jgi:hypothetical protein
MGLFLLVYGVSLLYTFGTMPPAHEIGADPMVGFMEGTVVLTMIIMGIAHLVPGVLQIWAGWRARSYRSRGLVIAAVSAGMLTILGCYCTPTSIAMIVWALVVVLNADVARRFAIGKVGQEEP